MKKFNRIIKKVNLDEGVMDTGRDNLIIKDAINKIIDRMEWGGNYQITVGKFEFNGLNYEAKILVDYMEEVEDKTKILEEKQGIKDSKEEVKNNEIIAYVDGSFDKDKKLCGSGIVFLNNEEQVEPTLIKSFSTYDKYNMWNIQGECEACLKAINIAINNKYNKITIYYDYQGIESWVKKVGNKREWKAKNDYTKGYVKRFDELSKQIKVEFVKVKGHSKDKWNDEADRLARESLGK